MIGPWVNHLWQSTLFAIAAGLFTVAFRKNRAQIRYWLWLSASLKFLLPFSLLMSLGNQLEWPSSAKSITTQDVSLAMVQISRPFPNTLSLAPRTQGAVDWIPIAVLGVWACGFAVLVLVRFRGWLRVRAAIRSSTPIDIPAIVELRSCPGLLEPGVIGFWKPILLLPADLLKSLTPSQIEAVLAHELCHIRRRDNLFAALHMIAEAIFWFHPLIWWIGGRLVEERERACDEDVLQLGSEPQVYAEAILNVCKHYLESPIVCVSGIASSDLKKRIHNILAQHVGQNLTLARKLLLALGGSVAMMAPIAIGSLNAQVSQAQSTIGQPRFAMASIKPSNSTDHRRLFDVQPDGRVTFANTPVNQLIQYAYGIKGHQISGGPDWMKSELFDIAAKTESSAKPDQLFLMLQSLLAERFRLVMRRVTQEAPVYGLTTAKDGPKLKEVHDTDPVMDNLFIQNAVNRAPKVGNSSHGRPPIVILRRGLLIAESIKLIGLANVLSDFLGRPVVDKTDLTGTYDLKVEWQPDADQVAMFQEIGVPEGYGAPKPDPRGPSLATALKEQLGLSIESEKGSVEMFQVEHIERPSAN
jgi:bla regulator protein BlaR1